MVENFLRSASFKLQFSKALREIRDRRDPNVVIYVGEQLGAHSGVAVPDPKTGLWAGHKIEDVFTTKGCSTNPARAKFFYMARKKELSHATPAYAHYAIAELQQQLRGRCTVITQGLDDLLERAGVMGVSRTKGSLLRQKCNACGFVAELKFSTSDRCTQCRSHNVFPDISLREQPSLLDESESRLKHADLIICVGVSILYPDVVDLILKHVRQGTPLVTIGEFTPRELSRIQKCSHVETMISTDLALRLVFEAFYREF